MLITIDQEIEAIWKRRFALPSLLYLLMRFGTLGFLILYAQGPLSFLGPPSLVVSTVYISYVDRHSPGIIRGMSIQCHSFVDIAQVSLRCKVEIYLLQGLITMVMFAVSGGSTKFIWNLMRVTASCLQCSMCFGSGQYGGSTGCSP